jgi:hypothetical protein
MDDTIGLHIQVFFKPRGNSRFNYYDLDKFINIDFYRSKIFGTFGNTT